MRDAIVDHINDRVRTIWESWRWPEWERTEERAFRTVWNDTRQFVRADANGNPDELYYLPNQTYYRVTADAVSDPPVGTIPTDGNYFETLDPVDTFIEYDQTCRRSIGVMLGVWKQNPRVPTGSQRGGLHYMPSERGIDVRCPGLPTVWITYKKPVPEFTMIPYVEGRTYEKADIVFYVPTGECFQALIETSTVPTNTTYWRWIPFLDVWSKYVVNGTFSDSLMEFDQGGNDDLQAKAALSQYWGQKAETAFEAETDVLIQQGQVMKWDFGGMVNGWYRSLPWYGGDVISIISAPFSSIVTDEAPAGVIDGANQTFTTAFSFSTLWVFLNGVRQTKGVDFTLDDHTGFTFITAPSGGSTLTVDYIRL